jgi:superfamily I DNA and/or RNA helicase
MQAEIIICTPFNTALIWLEGDRTAVPNPLYGHFSHILLDEVGQAKEPEMLIPLQFCSSDTAVVLCGDPKQLGPVVHAPVARERGLNVSMLERLRQQGAGFVPTIELVEQYRGHPHLLHISSELFYGSRLVSSTMCSGKNTLDLRAWGIAPQPTKAGFPLVFCALDGEDEHEPDTPCFHNPKEAEYIANELIPSLLAANSALNQDRKSIGVITPYRSQVVRIRRLLRRRRLNDVRVGTVEDYQGQEQRVVVVSVVRSSPKWLDWDKTNDMGILDSKRFNVSITRAQALMCIVGNPQLLQMERHWRALLQYCHRKDVVIGKMPLSVCSSTPIPDTPFIRDLSHVPQS